MTAQRLLSERPPLVRRAQTLQGPNTSSPTCVNGGDWVRRSAGKSDIFCFSTAPLNLLQVTHLYMTFVTSLFAEPYINLSSIVDGPEVSYRRDGHGGRVREDAEFLIVG